MGHECVNEFVSDALCANPFDSHPLTSFLCNKTKGKPFFIKQLLSCLSEQKTITLDPEKNLSGNGILITLFNLVGLKFLTTALVNPLFFHCATSLI